jgi:hypothetical protein
MLLLDHCRDRNIYTEIIRILILCSIASKGSQGYATVWTLMLEWICDLQSSLDSKKHVILGALCSNLKGQ